MMTPGTQSQPLVTIAMVTYNSAPYVATAIDSVLSSSYEHFELLISDDCSKDDTWQIISSYNDPRIRAMRNERNLGEYPNRDQCVARARGEYLIFIDGDDIIYPHGLEFMTRMLDAFPECGMALMYWFRNNIVFPAVLDPKQFYVGEYFGHGFLGTAFSNVLFRTGALRSAGPMANDYRCGDDYIRYHIAMRHASLLINDNLTWWRETSGQAYQQHLASGRLFFDSMRLKLEFLDHPECPLSTGEIAEARANIHLALAKYGWRCLMKGQVRKASRLLKTFRVPTGVLLFPFRQPVEKDPFGSYTADRPLLYPFAKNPYARKF